MISDFLPLFSGIFGIIVFSLIIAAAILGFFLPFFVYRIRIEAINTNIHLREIIKLLNKHQSDQGNGGVENSRCGNNKIRICPHCQGKNRTETKDCMKCGKPLV